MRKLVRLCALVALISSLSACGAMNAYTGAALTQGEADYSGAKQNIQKANDDAVSVWLDAGRGLTVGAVCRNQDAQKMLAVSCGAKP